MSYETHMICSDIGMSIRMDSTSLFISRQTKPPNSEHEAFLVYIIEKNLTSKFYAIMLTHHTVVAIHFRGLFFKFQRVRFLFLWVCTFGGPLLKLFSLSIILVAPFKTWLEHQTHRLGTLDTGHFFHTCLIQCLIFLGIL